MSETAVLILVATLVGAAAAAVTVKVVLKNRSKTNSRKTVQKGNFVGGDQAGGDITKGS